jgi:phosphoribosylglycinamide formyltransferase-1
VNADPLRKLRIAVLVSGGGTNLQALLDRSHSGVLRAEVKVVIADRSDAYGLVRAEQAGVPAHSVEYRAYLRGERGDWGTTGLEVDLEQLDRRQRIITQGDREQRRHRLGRLIMAEQEVLGILAAYQVDYVCLAGFMRLVSPYFLGSCNRDGQLRVLNIHPALLPSFPGTRGYEDTLDYGCRWGGVTVHFVDEGEDTGPIIAQAAYPIWPGEDLETVRRRGLALEYEVYAQSLNWVAAGQVEIYRRTDGRLGTHITDPSYRELLRSWMNLAFSS